VWGGPPLLWDRPPGLSSSYAVVPKSSEPRGNAKKTYRASRKRVTARVGRLPNGCQAAHRFPARLPTAAVTNSAKVIRFCPSRQPRPFTVSQTCP
jgi:hypothetical protein